MGSHLKKRTKKMYSETRGRKKIADELKKKPQKTVKINEGLVELVMKLKADFKSGSLTEDKIKRVFDVLDDTNTNTNDDDVNLKLVLERDKLRLEKVKQDSIIMSLKSTIRTQKYNYSELLHKEHDCMFIKKDGARCTKKSVIDAELHGLNIHVCTQHAKILQREQ